MYTEIQTEICVYVSLCVLDAELQRYMQACVRTQIRTDSHRYTWREENWLCVLSDACSWQGVRSQFPCDAVHQYGLHEMRLWEEKGGAGRSL